MKLKLPDPPPIDVFLRQARDALEAMSPEERRLALSRVKAYRRGLEALERELDQAPPSGRSP